MRVIADFHIHSKYSRATSLNMDTQSIYHYSQIKGLNLLGTGDFTHPLWLNELKNKLTEVPETNLYCVKENSNDNKINVYFMITTEVSTIYKHNDKVRKIHHIIMVPSLEIAEQIRDALKAKGDLSVDGRPTFDISASELAEEVISASRDNVIIPSHVWTPWFSLFGSINGFDSISDCYEDMTKHIFALETGLSSDPPMNWRLSSLDNYCLISNSDSHSPYPYRLGREANVFEVKEISYKTIIDSIRLKDSKTFKFTIETHPEYGKYHWTGHRNCNISFSSEKSKELGGICPVCHKRLTRGVEERVDELADRQLGFRPERAIDYVHLLPLQEIIATVLGTGNPAASMVWRIFNSLITKFGNEYTVLLDASKKDLESIVDTKIAEAIIKVRRDEVKIIPGYDGVYGKLIIKENKANNIENKKKDFEQTSLERYIL